MIINVMNSWDAAINNNPLLFWKRSIAIVRSVSNHSMLLWGHHDLSSWKGPVVRLTTGGDMTWVSVRGIEVGEIAWKTGKDIVARKLERNSSKEQ